MRRHLTPRGGGGLRLAAPAVVLVALALGADVAGAHTKLVRTAASARAVALTFSTPVSPRLTDIDVLAATGGELDPGEPRNAPGDPATVTVPMRGGLESGRYFVTWSTANGDGHVVNGVFDFRVRRAAVAKARRQRTDPAAPAAPVGPVGPAAASAAPVARAAGAASAGPARAVPGEPAAPEAPAAVRGALSVARIAQDAALTLAFGLVIFLKVVWRRMGIAGGRAGDEEVASTAPVDVAVRARLRALLVAAAGVGALSAAAAVVLQGAVLVRGAPWDSAAIAALPDVLTSRAGACWAVLAFLWIAAIAAARRRLDGPLLVGIAALLVVSPPLRGHSGVSPVGLAVVFHVAAAGAWIGGLVAMLAAAHASRAFLTLRERLPLLAATVSRFSAVALPCAAVALATGVVAAVTSLEGPEQLLTASYGRLVAAKLVLFGVIVVCAAHARRVHVARLWDTDGAGAATAMRKTIVLELALAATALTAAGNLAATGPPT